MTACNVDCDHYRCRASVAVWCGHPDFAGETGHTKWQCASFPYSKPEIFPGRFIREPSPTPQAPPEWCPISKL